MFLQKSVPYMLYPPVITTEFDSGKGTAQECTSIAPVILGIFSSTPFVSLSAIIVSRSMSNISITSEGDPVPPQMITCIQIKPYTDPMDFSVSRSIAMINK